MGQQPSANAGAAAGVTVNDGGAGGGLDHQRPHPMSRLNTTNAVNFLAISHRGEQSIYR